jgi:hypothetical protein
MHLRRPPSGKDLIYAGTVDHGFGKKKGLIRPLRKSGHETITMPNFHLVAVAQRLRFFDSGFVVIAGDDIGQP